MFLDNKKLNGDVSRRRRLIGPESKLSWYAFYRTVRFAESDFKFHHHGQSEKEMQTSEINQLFENFKNLNNAERWKVPFPMGVFGTLREGQGNNHRMYRGKIARHQKAFLPNFIARSLSILFNKDSVAPFEVFFYPNQKEWNKMIPSVDSLEGFSPEYHDGDFIDENTEADARMGYHRTLVWLHLLPEDYDHPIYHQDLWGRRDLKIPSEEWNQYEKIPCWVYSSISQNVLAKTTQTLIWG